MVPDSTTTFTPEDRRRLAKAFSLEDYKVTEDSNGLAYVAVTLPKEVEPWVRALRKGLLDRVQKRLEPVDRLETIAKAYDQTIRIAGLTEEQEIAVRRDKRVSPILDAAFGKLDEDESLTESQRRLIWKLFFQDSFYEDIRAIISWPFTRFQDERKRELEAQGLDTHIMTGIMYDEVVLGKSPYMQTYQAMFHDQDKGKLPIDRFIVRDSQGEEVIRSPSLNNTI